MKGRNHRGEEREPSVLWTTEGKLFMLFIALRDSEDSQGDRLAEKALKGICLKLNGGLKNE